MSNQTPHTLLIEALKENIISTLDDLTTANRRYLEQVLNDVQEEITNSFFPAILEESHKGAVGHDIITMDEFYSAFNKAIAKIIVN
jgi:hypothetical protein